MKLVASDMDGTIIDRTGRISVRTVRAFAACRAAGIEVVFVTGRPPRWLTPLEEQLNFRGTVICSNGAVMYNLAERRVISAQTMPMSSVLSAVDIIRDIYPRAVFAAETTTGFHVEPGFADDLSKIEPGLQPRLLSESLIAEAETGTDGARQDGTAAPDPGSGVVKLLAKERGLVPDDFLATVTPAVDTLVSVTHSSPGVAILEMALPEVNKAAALSRYAAELGIDAKDVLAFGDMPNDVAMLQWSGHGYAMASGHKQVLAAAQFEAPAFADDGVAQVLEARLAELPDRARA